MSEITNEQRAAIAATLKNMTLPAGLGDEHAACSIAAINLALSGRLTDDIPECMSVVIGRWIIVTQDAMPDQMRNSDRWKSLLPLAAGTGRALEKERVAIILDHMWSTALPSLQPLADKHNFSSEWLHMTIEKTEIAATAAAAAAEAAAAAAEAAEAAEVAIYAAATAAAAARAAAAAVRGASWAAWGASWAEAGGVAEVAASWAEAGGAASWAEAAARAEVAAEVAASWAEAAARAEVAAAWDLFDPCGLLQKLIEVE